MLTQSDLKTLSQIFAKMDRQDFATVADMYKQAQAMCTRREAAVFRVGDTVYFDSKRGMRVTGKIQKINRKTIHVSTTEGTWKVSPSLLKSA
jgi:hypothetical protein